MPPVLLSPIAASLGRCAELLGVDLDTQEAASHVEPYLRVDGTPDRWIEVA